MRRFVLLLAVCVSLAATAFSQDPVKVDAQHYKVESENAKVRILRIHYGPHEKSPMHYHPDSVAIFLTDSDVKFGLPGGKSEEKKSKAGDAVFTPAGKHAPENLSDQPFDVILVELKGKSSAGTPAAPK